MTVDQGALVLELGPAVTVEGLGWCQSGYCDRPAVAYVTRMAGPSPRFLAVLGHRGEQLAAGVEGSGSPLGLRCLDCAHDELDTAVDGQR